MRTAPRDRGQAAVEFALALPLVAVIVLGVVQVVIVGGRQVAVERLARDGARAASVSGDPTGAAQRAVAGDGARLAAHTTVQLGTLAGTPSVTVTVTVVDTTSVPLIGWAIGDVTLTGSATMPREPP